MKKVMLIAAISSAVMFGCSKEEINENTPQAGTPQTIEYMPLAIGNYWVYDTYSIDTLGNETFSSTDSAYINRDTVINSKQYFLVEGGGYAQIATGNIIRNENNSIYEYSTYDSSEIIRFTTNNLGSIFRSFTDTLANTTYTSWVNTQNESAFIGNNNFLCYDMQTEINNYTLGFPYPIRNFHRYYNQNIGVAINQFSYSSNTILFETRLVRYNIN